MNVTPLSPGEFLDKVLDFGVLLDDNVSIFSTLLLPIRDTRLCFIRPYIIK